MMELDPVEGGQTGRSLKIMMGLDGKLLQSWTDCFNQWNQAGTATSSISARIFR